MTLDFGYESESDGKPFIQASFIAQEAQPNESGIYYIQTDILPPTVVNTENFPTEVQRAFLPVQSLQRTIGKQQTVTTSLVSVKDILLKKPVV